MSAISEEYAEPMGSALAAVFRRHLTHIAAEDLSTKRWLMLEKTISLSYDAQRSVAWLPSQKWFSVMTGLHPADVSNAVKELISVRMIERWRAHGGYYYRILPQPDSWLVRWRQPDPQKRQEAIRTEAWLFNLNKVQAEERYVPLPSESVAFGDALVKAPDDCTSANGITAFEIGSASKQTTRNNIEIRQLSSSNTTGDIGLQGDNSFAAMPFLSKCRNYPMHQDQKFPSQREHCLTQQQMA